MNDLGTAALLDGLGSCDRPGPLFHISTAYICGDITGVALEDNDECRSRSFRNSYEASKHGAELRVRAAFANGLHGAIFRPSVIIGDESSSGAGKAVEFLANSIMKVAAQPESPLTLRLPPNAQLNVVHSDWVLESMMELAAHRVEGSTYHLTARNSLLFASLADALMSEHSESLLRLDPTADLRSLSPLSRLVDRALNPLRSYLTADVRFDRRNFDRDASLLADLIEFDPGAVFKRRLVSTLEASIA